VSVGVYIYLCVFFDDARPSGPIDSSRKCDPEFFDGAGE
jgi:hypothetical protein